MKVELQDRVLRVSFEEPQKTLSWAICGGGKNVTDQVLWIQVSNEELALSIDPKQFLMAELQRYRAPDAIGMLTSADLRSYQRVEKSHDGISVECMATVGLTNALRIGDVPAQTSVRVGTINLLCAVSAPLSEETQLEALSLAAEARTTAVLESHILSSETGKPATGTGTDCIVMASPHLALEDPLITYAGKHTLLGSLIGQAVFEAVSLGIHEFKKKSIRGV